VSNVGYATISIIPDLKGFRTKLNEEVRTSSVSAGKEGGKGFGGAMIGTVGAMGIGLAVGAALDIGKQVLEFDSNIQSATTALTTLLHSPEKANALIGMLETLAQKSTLLDSASAIKLGQMLVGMGTAAKDVIPTMTALTDATAGVGGSAETLDALTRAWGQMTAKGKIQSDEILQMTEQGIPALQLLAKAYGVPVGTMSDMISKGKVLSSDALPKLRSEMEKSFGGADAAAGANSLGGAFDRIKESLMGIAGSLAMPLVKALTPFLASIADTLSSPKIQAFADSIGPRVTAFFTGLSKLFSGGGIKSGFDGLGTAFQHIVETGQDLFTTLKPIAEQIFEVWKKDIGPNLIPTLSKLMTLLGDFISTISIVVQWWWKVFGPSFLSALDITYKAVVKIVNAVIDIFEGLFEIIQGLFTGDWSLLWQGVKDVFKGLWDAIVAILVAAWDLIGAVLSGLWAGIKEIFSGIGDWFVTEVWDPIKHGAQAAWDWIVGIWNGAVSWFQTNVWKPIKDGVTGAWTWIKDTISDTWTGIKNVWNDVTSFFSGVWDSITGAVSSAFDATVDFFQKLPGRALDFLKALPGMALQGLTDLAYAFGYGIGLVVKEVEALPGQIWDLLTSVWHGAVDIVTNLWADVTGWFTRMKDDAVAAAEALPGLIGAAFDAAWNWVTTTAAKIWADVTGWFTKTKDDTVSTVESLPDKIAGFFSDMWSKVTAWASQLWSDVTGWFKRMAEDAWNFVSGLPGKIAALFRQLWDDATKAVSDGVDATMKFFTDLPGKVTNALSGLGQTVKDACKDAIHWLEDAGKAVIDGLINGIKGAWHKVTDLIGGLGHAISSGFKDAIDSHSPSKVFAKHGRDIVAGIVVGVTDSQHQAIGAVQDMGVNIANAFSNGGPIGIGASLSGAVANGNGRTLNYYAGSNSLSSEDELFAAASSSRMVW
jgi:tape measure domain-containing protein